MDLDQLRDDATSRRQISFDRMECTITSSVGNRFPWPPRDHRLADSAASVVVDAGLISENAYLIKQRRSTTTGPSRPSSEIMGQAVSCISGQSCAVRGGMITNNEQHFKAHHGSPSTKASSPTAACRPGDRGHGRGHP